MLGIGIGANGNNNNRPTIETAAAPRITALFRVASTDAADSSLLIQGLAK